MYDTDPKQARKERRQRIKEGITSNQGKIPKEARLDSRATYEVAKKNYRLTQKDYALHKRPQPTAKALFFKQQRDKVKLDYQVAKTIYKRAKKADGTYIPNRLKRRAKQGTRMKLRQDVEQAIRDNDTLGDVIKARQDIRQFHYQKNASKRALNAGGKLAKYSFKHSYGQLNRAYNFTRGRGYTRTPKEFSWEGKLTKKMRQMRQRAAQTKAGRVAKGTGKAVKVVSKPIRSILANPLAIKSYFLMFLIFGFFSLFMSILGGSSPVQQNEFDLNQSWLQISKRDREKSNDKVDYWTNIDDVLFFMNYRYGSEWSPNSKWSEGTGGEWAGKLGFNHYSDALNDLWNHLNDDPQNLKRMADLYDPSSDLKWAKLTKEELEDYEELVDLTKEVGHYPSYQELDNPFYSEEDPSYANPLVILKRFGYTSTTEVYEKTQLKATLGQSLKAPLSGKISLQEDTVTIQTLDVSFSFEKVGSIRVSDGATVASGEEVGKVTTNGYQIIHYQKLEEKEIKNKKAKWTSVNPGFYFQSVVYNQTTSVLTTLDGDLGQKAKVIKDYLKQKLPGLTDKGVAAMLGNFATESNINPKRAEGDYLAPPVGVSSSSWDDEAWLSLSGPAIYNGAYPNIIHRGLGLGQWTDTADGSVRHTLLLNYAKAKNKKWYDLELQLEFMLEGDSPYYISIAKEILTSNDDVEILTKRFLNNWEGNAGDKLLERQNNAKQIHSFLTQPILGGGQLASSWNFPEEYRSKVTNPPTQNAMTTQSGNAYPIGQCTWYVYNRLVELGSIKDLSGAYSSLGNGQDWVRNLVAKGWKFSMTPKKGAVVSVLGGFGGTYPQYGHVAIVEYVNPDGTFLVSECNIAGVQDKVHFSVLTPAHYYTFATP
ncbi:MULTISPECIES: phage tail tip lysozyme [unclassified Streptococcus]|uniref:phage tail tip lysozyme n=1 Tax=unclassified Streptococcus TaxID=2608887 RepID=UPI0010725953|nr:MULTISPECIES: phage tail tip lysozyme [unclassified Streptococcus]MBF0786675.1 CHAP domain-containing protein [Streptococcus sp. 19428wC2_LYSM12]MCQ9211702.1 phage tail tip lysozyme [Streptococcus sp. B01]MCQ9213109.1 phage tail tip lysozyme [Streptococcus sp. O1]TFV06427.1 CHAP domain-containing protein [Streptococcus sp. LYSM12]